MVREELQRHGGDERTQYLGHLRNQQRDLRHASGRSIVFAGYGAGAAGYGLLDVGEGLLAQGTLAEDGKGTARRRGPPSNLSRFTVGLSVSPVGLDEASYTVGDVAGESGAGTAFGLERDAGRERRVLLER